MADIKALAKRLQSTWLMYWVGDSDTLVWVVTPEGDVHWQRVPVTLAKIESLVAQSVPRGTALDGLAAVALGSRAHLRPWRELYQLLIKPVSAHLPTAPGARLTIVPHGPLFRLSFAALPDEAGRVSPRTLRPALRARRGGAAVHIRDPRARGAAVAARRRSGVERDMPRLRLRRRHRQTAAATAASAIMASTNGGGTRDATLPELGWARREVTSIAKLLPGESDTLVGAEATEGGGAPAADRPPCDSLRDAWRGPQRSDAGVVSRHARPGDAADGDGRLTADEIDRFSLDADLVVLSACGTALGPISGDGVQGFTRAFLSAGAGSVIATTWSVADRTSYQVMEGFYREWIAGGQNKARALRESQLAMLRQLRKGGITIDGVVLHESPWLWAGFVLVGNP